MRPYTCDICIKKLSGHSGCTVLLMKSPVYGFYVRKISASQVYNSRLKVQAAKQITFFKGQHAGSLATPRIYDYGYINKLFYFDMEHVLGENLCNAICHISIENIHQYIQKLAFHITSIPRRFQQKTALHFQNKLTTLKKSIAPTAPLLQDSFSILENFDFSSIPESPCCGDLTLENIIVTRSGNIYLIDFLDSFFNSFYIDIAKILQDLYLGWAYRYHSKNINREIRCLIARTLLEKELAEKNIDIKVIYHLVLLNILRIIPYIKDQTTKKFIEKSIKDVLAIIKNFNNR